MRIDNIKSIILTIPIIFSACAVLATPPPLKPDFCFDELCFLSMPINENGKRFAATEFSISKHKNGFNWSTTYPNGNVVNFSLSSDWVTNAQNFNFDGPLDIEQSQGVIEIYDSQKNESLGRLTFEVVGGSSTSLLRGSPFAQLWIRRSSLTQKFPGEAILIKRRVISGNWEYEVKKLNLP